MRARRPGAAALAAALVVACGASAQNGPTWSRSPFGAGGTDDSVLALATFDDGGGTAVYAAGRFRVAGNVEAHGVARLRGRGWSAVGGGIDGVVNALEVFDDGGGPALYAGGSFQVAGGTAASNVAKWDGVAWSALGAGVGGTVNTLAAFDDGSGPALYAGGSFDIAGGAPADRVARWDGRAWSAVGGGLQAPPGQGVLALAAHDDGSGPALYAGGEFVGASGLRIDRLARWSGAAWQGVGSGLNDAVKALESFGGALYVGGEFDTALPSTRALHVVRWDGSRLAAFGTDLSGPVEDFAVHDGVLHVGGWIPAFGGVARFEGNAWREVGGRPFDSIVHALASVEDAGTRRLVAGGDFLLASGSIVEHAAEWDGVAWTGCDDSGVDASARALESASDATGHTLYAAGSFLAAGGTPASRVARWKGRRWSALGSGLSGPVNALRVFDDGSGDALYAGGEFLLAGATTVNHVARWDGLEWTALGDGVDGVVLALAVFDDGGGPALYAGGKFASAGGRPAANVAKWDGSEWRPLGVGTTGEVRALATFSDGAGSRLVAGGAFTRAGDIVTVGVASWDGTAWSALGSGLQSQVFALAEFDDGAGPALYAGGAFTGNLARWNGAEWLRPGGGTSGRVSALLAYDDGSGPALYLGGEFFGAGTVGALRIARWSGTAFSALEAGFDAPVLALERHVAEDGVGLFAAGVFTRANRASSQHVARWLDPGVAGLTGSVDARFGPPADVLFVNDSAGGPARRLAMTTFVPIRVFVSTPPRAAGAAPFALYLRRGDVDPSLGRDLPLGLGRMAFPSPLTGESDRIVAIWNNTGRARLGAPALASSPAPSEVASAPHGTRRPMTFVLQGVIADPGSAAAVPVSVTNGVIVQAR